MGHDLLVNLYEINETPNPSIRIERVLSPNCDLVCEFIKDAKFSSGWVSEVKAGLYKPNPTVFIAICDGKIVGFAGYDCTAKGYFGPIGLYEEYRGKGIGKALVLRTLLEMRNDGYGYAIIGWVMENKIPFYQKCVKLTVLEETKKWVYQRLI